MSTTTPARHPSGTPIGGQFAPGVNAAPTSDVALTDPSTDPLLERLAALQAGNADRGGDVGRTIERIVSRRLAAKYPQLTGVEIGIEGAPDDTSVYVHSVTVEDDSDPDEIHDEVADDVYEMDLGLFSDYYRATGDDTIVLPITAEDRLPLPEQATTPATPETDISAAIAALVPDPAAARLVPVQVLPAGFGEAEYGFGLDDNGRPMTSIWLPASSAAPEGGNAYAWTDEYGGICNSVEDGGGDDIALADLADEQPLLKHLESLHRNNATLFAAAAQRLTEDSAFTDALLNAGRAGGPVKG